jgi:hypothetical protein
MKFQLLTHGWPVGAVLIPAGTVLDYDDEKDWLAQLAKKQGCLPVNTLCLDADAWAYSCSLYPSHSFDSNHLPQGVAGVVAKEQP